MNHSDSAPPSNVEMVVSGCPNEVANESDARYARALRAVEKEGFSLDDLREPDDPYAFCPRKLRIAAIYLGAYWAEPPGNMGIVETTPVSSQDGHGTPLAKAVATSGMTQRQIAAFLGISPTRLSRLVLGRYSPRCGEAKRLAELLRTTAAEVFPSGKYQAG